MKADKTALLDAKGLRKLKDLQDENSDDRKLLSSIARSVESVRVIGAQEAVDNLLRNPLIFTSAEVLNINTNFLLYHPGALSEEEFSAFEAARHEGIPKTNASSNNVDHLLHRLDKDELASVPNGSRSHNSHISLVGPVRNEFTRNYMRRPHMLESLLALLSYMSSTKSSRFERISLDTTHICFYSQLQMINRRKIRL